MVESLVGYFDNAFGSEDSCIKFDSKTRLITVACKSARVSDIDKQVDNSSILKRESLGSVYKELAFLLNSFHSSELILNNYQTHYMTFGTDLFSKLINQVEQTHSFCNSFF